MPRRGLLDAVLAPHVRDPVARDLLAGAASTLGDLAKAHVAATRAICTHSGASTVLETERGTARVCLTCFRVIVHLHQEGLPR